MAMGAGAAFAQSAPADTDPPGSIPVFPPQPGTAPAGVVPAAGEKVPELLHYKFEGTGTSVPNLASNPPAGTATATIMGSLTQTGTDLNTAGNGFSLRGSGLSAATDYLDTGWATNLGSSWTISFASAGIAASGILYYVFGDSSAGDFRCFTNGVAGANNWILRGPIADVLVPGGALQTKTRTTFVYDATAGHIRAYLDGVLVNTVAQAPFTLAGTGPFKVMGRGTSVGAPDGGLLDDFRVYDRALTPEEVAAIDTAVGNLEIGNGGTLAFPDQLVGTTSAAGAMTLANTGSAALNVTGLTAAAAPFARTGGSCPATLPFALAAGASCTLDYTFAPTAVATSSQVLDVTADAPGSGTITLSGTGVQGNLTIDPVSVSFGDQAVGTTSGAGTVTLANTGNAPLDVTALTAAAAPFARAGGSCPATLPITLAAGASCTLDYTFAPTAAASSSQMLGVTADAPGSGSITLDGTGIQGSLGIAPASVSFGDQGVGSTSAASTVTLSNTGTAPLDVTALTAAVSPFARVGGSCPAGLPITLAVGASCTLDYAFTPTVATASSQVLDVTTDAAGSGSITLDGTGIQGSLSINPSSVAFGDQGVGSTSAASTVTFSNTGSASLDITTLTAAAAPFARVGGSCAVALPITLAAGASCTLDYTFAPTTATSFSQVLDVTTDATGSGSITLGGTGAEGVLGVLSSVVDFGQVAVHGTRSGTVTITNGGNAALLVTALTAPQAPFALIGGTCGGLPITVDAGGSCTLVYSFTPTAGQSFEQAIAITSGNGSATVTLSGSGMSATAIPSTSGLGLALLLLTIIGFAAHQLRR